MKVAERPVALRLLRCATRTSRTASRLLAAAPSGAASGLSPFAGHLRPFAALLLISVRIENFPDHDHLASYCGVAPRSRRSGTSISSVSASRQGNKRLKNLLIFSCNSLARSNNASASTTAGAAGRR